MDFGYIDQAEAQDRISKISLNKKCFHPENRAIKKIKLEKA